MYYLFQGAFWGLILGLIVGIIRMVLDFSFRAPLCGSGDPDNRPTIVSKVDFLHFAAILGLVTTGAMILISMFTEPRPGRKVVIQTFVIQTEILNLCQKDSMIVRCCYKSYS